jgi:hypothetical protein
MSIVQNKNSTALENIINNQQSLIDSLKLQFEEFKLNVLQTVRNFEIDLTIVATPQAFDDFSAIVSSSVAGSTTTYQIFITYLNSANVEFDMTKKLYQLVVNEVVHNVNSLRLVSNSATINFTTTDQSATKLNLSIFS